jgi:hypothetical protein
VKVFLENKRIRGYPFSMTRLPSINWHLLVWIFCSVWLLTIYPQGFEYRGEETTNRVLAENHRILQSFVRVWADTPHSAAELAAFSKGSFQFFDGYGHTIEYLRLSEENFLLRSFGQDGRQNILFRKADPGIHSLGQIPEGSLVYKPKGEESRWRIYPFPLLEGSFSPNGDWYAQVFADPITAQRKLLVRHSEKPIYLIARHDFVEEFLWLPNSHSLVFTASMSGSYGSGLYVWDLSSDRSTNFHNFSSRR